MCSLSETIKYGPKKYLLRNQHQYVCFIFGIGRHFHAGPKLKNVLLRPRVGIHNTSYANS